MARQTKTVDHQQQSVSLTADLIPESHTLESRPFTGVGTSSVANQPILLIRIYGLLEQYLQHSPINVNWLADQLAMNRKTLYRKVQTLTRQTPDSLIRYDRLGRAADLLRMGYTVAETAKLIGFKTSSHFASGFNEFYQQTPTEFIASRVRNL